LYDDEDFDLDLAEPEPEPEPARIGRSYGDELRCAVAC
jgi:hypothetical protein